jgi:5-methylcytosine-specific restriction endonuclease McrA
MKIIVLNADYQPINVTSLKKGFNLVYKGKAEVLVSDDEEEILILTKKMAMPKIIRLNHYINLPYRRLNLSKTNIFKRDGHMCIYEDCGSTENLTLDHLLPKSRGGKNTWENLVTCCKKCNCKKDNRTPSEAGMKLRHKPFIPTLTNLLGFNKNEIIENVFEKSMK